MKLDKDECAVVKRALELLYDESGKYQYGRTYHVNLAELIERLKEAMR